MDGACQNLQGQADLLAPRDMTTRTSSTALSLGLGLVTVLGLASPVGAQTGPTGYTAERCQPLASRALDVDVVRSGVRVSYAGDGYATCDEAVVVTSYASAGPEVDNHVDPALGQAVLQASALEAAGASGILVALPIDPCWAGIEVHRDGDTLVWDDVVGDGCELTIETDFAGTPHASEVHVVQQSGNIQPPHIFDHDEDATTVLTGLPDGTWYVKVYEGAVDGTTMQVDGGGAAEVAIVNGVADGSTVSIVHPADLGLAAEVEQEEWRLEPVHVKSWSTTF
jgi:hypothetical protein